MILKTQRICPQFTVMVADRSVIGVATVRFPNHVTGETEHVEIDIYTEMMIQAESPFHKAVLLNLLANKGFLISPLPGALESFYHACLFPEDAVSTMGKLNVEPLPKDTKVTVISSNETVIAIRQEAA